MLAAFCLGSTNSYPYNWISQLSIQYTYQTYPPWECCMHGHYYPKKQTYAIQYKETFNSCIKVTLTYAAAPRAWREVMKAGRATAAAV